VTAIDVLLDPDATMMQHAVAVNTRLRSENPNIQRGLIDYVEAFVPKHSGANYVPHVATGLAPHRVSGENSR
jgi:hypothetical protein